MFTSETFVAILREIPGFLDIVVRYLYELAMHTIGIGGDFFPANHFFLLILPLVRHILWM